MLRQALIRRFRKIDIPVPEGHLRRNKGVSTYFFEKEKRAEVEGILREAGCFDDGPTPLYVRETRTWRDHENVRRCLLHDTPDADFVSVGICGWPG